MTVAKAAEEGESGGGGLALLALLTIGGFRGGGFGEMGCFFSLMGATW